jgi:dihydrofolate reductase
MKLQVDLYITVTVEGYIADAKGGTDWALNQELRDQTAQKYGCVCMGRVAFKRYDRPSGVHVIVLTKKLPKRHTKGVSFVSSPQAAVLCAQKLGFKKLLVLGGAQTNQSFMQAGLIKRAFADIHPVFFGPGQHMLGNFYARFDYKMIRQAWNGEFIHAEYAMGKTHTTEVAVVVRDDHGNYLVRQLKEGVCLGDMVALGVTEQAEDVARQLVKQFTRTDYKLTECGVFDITPTHHVHLFEAIITRCPFSQRKAKWVNSQELNQFVVDKKITPQTVQAHSFYKQWL